MTLTKDEKELVSVVIEISNELNVTYAEAVKMAIRTLREYKESNNE